MAMAEVDGNKGKNEFFFTWVIENFSCSTLKYGECIKSPPFLIKVTEGTEWKCCIYPIGESDENYVGLFLCRNEKGNIDRVSVGYELQMLNQEGRPEISSSIADYSFSRNEGIGFEKFISKNDLYVVKRKTLLHKDCLILRARIWKSKGCGNFTETTHCFARTRIRRLAVSFFSAVKYFRSMTAKTNRTVVAPEFRSIRVRLSLHGGPCCNENLKIEVSTKDSEKFKIIFASVSFFEKKRAYTKIKACPNATEGTETWALPCFYPTKLLSTKGYLKNDTLHLYFKFVVSRGVAYEAIESLVSGPGAFMDGSTFVREMLRGNNFDDFKKSEMSNDLIHGLRSMQQDSSLSDVTLRVGSRSFPAHRALLSARSPVFKVMFAADMREGAEGMVQVEDIDGDTLQRLLDFLYTDSAGEFIIGTAKKLYFAADKYQVLRLRRICAHFLTQHICVNNVCELLVLADAHGDVRFKSSLVSFIEEHSFDVCATESWTSMMKTHPRLAAETMFRKFSKH